MNQKNLQSLTILKIFNEFKAKAKESNFIFPRHRSNSGLLNGLTIELKCFNLLIPLNQACHAFFAQLDFSICRPRLVREDTILLIVFWFLDRLFIWSIYKLSQSKPAPGVNFINTKGLCLTFMKFHKPLLAFKMPNCGVLNVKKVFKIPIFWHF